MRLVVMFDLPTATKAERSEYARFRKFLVEDGYLMNQYSVYSRVMLSRDSADAHIERLRANLPPAGKVTVLSLTEKQYEDRLVLVDTRPGQPEDLGAQLTLAF